MTTPANIVTGFLMYANSHYYYSLDCCNPEGSHTGVYVSSSPTTIYSCDDPDKHPIDIGGPVIEELVAGENPNYEFAVYNLKADSVVGAAKSAPGLTLASLGKITFQGVPEQLGNKAYGLYSVDYNHRTYLFAVYEGATSGGESTIQPTSAVSNSGLLYVVPVNWNGKAIRVRVLAHN